MKILITENQLRILKESTSFNQEKFHKYFAHIFDRVSKRLNFKSVGYDRFKNEISKYDNKYFNNMVYYYIYENNVTPNINWYNSDLYINTTVYLDSSASIILLPNNLTIGGNLILNNTNIILIPDNLTVHGNLLLSHTSISSIPNNLKVNNILSLIGTPLGENYRKDEIEKMIKDKNGSVGGIKGVKKYKPNDDVIIWEPTSRMSTYTFSNPKTSKLVVKFTDYIKSQKEKNEPATRKDFLTKYYPGNVVRGYFTTFFASIKDAKIVTKNNKNEYSLGPNYENFLRGKLVRQKYY